MYNWKYHYALKNRFEQEYKTPKEAGIYLWTRVENGITYFYVGQAKNLFNRRFDYYKIQKGLAYPTRHFEASLKKHKDWTFQVIETCAEGMLDYCEKKWIDYYNAQPNHITRNDLIANQDLVRSNFRRIEQIKNRQNKALSKCLGYLTTELTPTSLKICLKMTKKGKPTALSSKYFEKLLELLGIKGEKNGNKMKSC